MATPEYFCVYAKRMLKAGVKGVGGCCGTTSEHLEMLTGPIRMLAAGVSDFSDEVEFIIILFIGFFNQYVDGGEFIFFFS